uniref:Uncharacterized protein n=1 Tax=Anguilla anguilla TaxID=7936 RepID=A0A0E9R9M5_ANGAN
MVSTAGNWQHKLMTGALIG